jgi:hypothetical protein
LKEVLAKMVLEKPYDPREFLIKEFEQIKSKKQTSLLGDKDFEAIF